MRGKIVYFLLVEIESDNPHIGPSVNGCGVGVKTECQFVYFKSHIDKKRPFSREPNQPPVKMSTAENEKQRAVSHFIVPRPLNRHTNVPNRCIESSSVSSFASIFFFFRKHFFSLLRLPCTHLNGLRERKNNGTLRNHTDTDFFPFGIHFLCIRLFHLTITYLIQISCVIFQLTIVGLPSFYMRYCTCRAQQTTQTCQHMTNILKLFHPIILSELMP